MDDQFNAQGPKGESGEVVDSSTTMHAGVQPGTWHDGQGNAIAPRDTGGESEEAPVAGANQHEFDRRLTATGGF